MCKITYFCLYTCICISFCPAGDLCHTLEGHTLELVCLGFNPHGTMAVTGSMDSTARLWNVATGAPLAILSDHEGELISVAFNSTGELLLTGSFDRTARVWDVRTGKCVHRLDGHGGEVKHLLHMALHMALPVVVTVDCN